MLAGRCWLVRRPGRCLRACCCCSPTRPPRRQLEDELIQTAWHSRMILEQLPTIHWTVNPSFRITQSTGTGLAQAGADQHQMVGRTLYRGAADRRPGARADPDAPASPGGRNGPLLRRVEGASFFEVVLEPFRAGEDSSSACSGLAHDVTERRRVEEERPAAAAAVLPGPEAGEPGPAGQRHRPRFRQSRWSASRTPPSCCCATCPDSPQRTLAELISQAEPAGRVIDAPDFASTPAGKAPVRRLLDLNEARPATPCLCLLGVSVARSSHTPLSPPRPPERPR